MHSCFFVHSNDPDLSGKERAKCRGDKNNQKLKNDVKCSTTEDLKTICVYLQPYNSTESQNVSNIAIF